MGERIPLTPPDIPPVAAGQTRPLWSVMIPVFNCAQFLKETLESVLKDDLGETQMQIEVVDDASTDDDVEALVSEVGKGRVSYFCQKSNVGSLRNFETCINRSRGVLVHLLHGDDRVNEGFYSKMTNLYNQYPEAGAFICHYAYITEKGKFSHYFSPLAKENGVLVNWFERITEKQLSQYVATVVRREVYEKLGSFYGVTYGEDWEMWVRIAKYYPVAYTPQTLAEYREHRSSISWKKALEGKNSDDIIRAAELISKHLPEKDRKKLISKNKRDCAFFCISMANRIWRATADRNMSLRQINLALGLSRHISIYYHVLKFYLKLFVRKY